MSHTCRILYVDDSRFDRELVKDALTATSSRFLLTEAASRAEFEALLANAQYDLVLSDFNIVGFEGLQVIDAVKAQHPDVPVVIVTGTGSEEIAVEAMKRGASDYVIKTPQHIQRLSHTIHAVIEQNQRRQEHERVERAMHRISRARKVMAECNHTLVHANAETELLQEMCRIVVESGGYRMAWIGYANGERDEAVIPMAHAGEGQDYLSELLAVWAQGKRDWSPSIRAVQSGRTYAIPDIAAVQGHDDWCTHALIHGYRSVTALPLKDGNRVFGALTVYESEPHELDTEEIAMFEELAEDISYGVISQRIKLAREQADMTLRVTEEKLTSILNSIDNIVWSTSKSELLYINPVAERIYGRPLADFYQNKDLWFEAIHPEDQERVRDAMQSLLDGGALMLEYRVVQPNGEIFWLEARTRAVRDSKGRLVRIDGVASDISERKAHEAHIEYLATHDALTGLANRNMLGDRLRRAVSHARRTNQLLALLFLDMDRFKDVNDSFGHTFGDKLLQAVAARLQEQVRDSDTVSRHGGDEFIVLLTNLGTPEDVSKIVGKLLNSFAAPFIIDNHKLYVTVSIGASVYPNDGNDIEILLKNADTAMYRAKDESGSGFQFYSQEMGARAIERVELEGALRRAVEHQEFMLLYQPQVDLGSGRIVGAEALIRWRHPVMGLITPERFIPLAEEIGLIVPIGEWVLRTACAQGKAWQDAGLPHIRVAVNLSARQFRREGLLDSVVKALRNAAFDAQYLELELTESMVMNGAEQFIAKLHALKEVGVQLSIDDFGTGYSSLSYLKRFSVDRLKIDQSFIRDIAINPDDAAITRSVIALGHSLNLKVIAEGVETEEQLGFLRGSHCDEMQGYYFSKPVSADEFAALLRTSSGCKQR